jgi:hypothetical protein
MKRSAVLGKVAPESYKDFLDAVEAAAQLLEKLGRQELEGLTPETEIPWQAYKLMNGLGFNYGAALARAYTEHIREDLDVPGAISRAITDLAMTYNDIEGQAAAELPQLVPNWLDMDKVLAAAQASYEGKGVYLNDFYYSILQAFSDFERAFRLFLLNDKRPENMIFRREGIGGEFIPAALLDLNEDEEKALLKTVIRETNKKIAERGFYGMHQEVLPPKGDFTILYWSNGAEAWFVDNRTENVMIARDKGRTSVPLDANGVIVPFHQIFLEKVVAGLDDLPLYVYSTEGKERGDYPEPTNKNVQKAVRSIVQAQNPDLDYEEQALLAAEMFGHLAKAKRYDKVSIAIVRAWLELQPVNLFPFIRLIQQWMGFE